LNGKTKEALHFTPGAISIL